MTTLILIRHAEAEANVRQIVGGFRGDAGLTPRGVVQAERLRDRLAATGEIAAQVLVASSLPRARQTAEILAPALSLPVTLDDDLQELRPGEADGLPIAEAIARFGAPDFESDPSRSLCPGAESWSGFMRRAGDALDRILDAHAGRTIVAVTHGGVIDGAFARFLRLPADRYLPAQFATRHASLTRWERRLRADGAAGFRLSVFNDTAHLRDIDRPARIPWDALALGRS